MTAKTEPPNTVDRRAIWAYAYIYMHVNVCVYYIHDDNNKSNNNNDSDSIIHYQNVPFNECLLLN